MVWVFLFVLFSFFKEISCHVWILLVYFKFLCSVN